MQYMSDIIEYKCPRRGVFLFQSQHMKCPYCDTEMTVEEFQRTQKVEDTQTAKKTDSEENWYSMSSGQWQNDEINGVRVYSCQSCGSEIVADETTGATTCPFCNNKITMKGQFSGDLKPDYIIPFKLDKKAANMEKITMPSSSNQHGEREWLFRPMVTVIRQLLQMRA